ncbi:unnamed protein product [Durusdinium trenchii]|uniref:Uncharacterized protein n=2 Tax=Durusdinium trenchii TaxID=1381693 RepID=A0ABP0KJ17_9DINO
MLSAQAPLRPSRGVVTLASPRYSKIEAILHKSPVAERSQLSPRAADAQGIAAPAPVDQDYAEGAEVWMGNHRFVCTHALGRGSYGEVWRAKVISGEKDLKEVALKEVLCQSQGELQQAIFEVQVLLALERAAQVQQEGIQLRVPRCIAYKVGASPQGWRVRTAMTVAPGESLDCFIRRPAPAGCSCLKALRKALVLVGRLLRDIGPSLQLLGPIAWHRDVNSHNILVDGAQHDSPELCESASFWLIDFGLAVDSQSWVSETGKWRTEYIGGDSRYWPPSSWIMHLVGPEGFDRRPDLCEQYQRRLDIHGLGITALELLCSMTMACTPGHHEEELRPWLPILEAWKSYREAVWHWWSVVYAVFSTGGDLGPVQQQLVEERLIERLLDLLSRIRMALRRCAEELPQDKSRKLLRMIADMLDEGKTFDLREIQRLLGGPMIDAKPKPKRFHTSPSNGHVCSPLKAEVALQANRMHSARISHDAERREKLETSFPGHQSLLLRMQSFSAQLRERKVQEGATALELQLQQLRRKVVGQARHRLQHLAAEHVRRSETQQ